MGRRSYACYRYVAVPVALEAREVRSIMKGQIVGVQWGIQQRRVTQVLLLELSKRRYGRRRGGRHTHRGPLWRCTPSTASQR